MKILRPSEALQAFKSQGAREKTRLADVELETVRSTKILNSIRDEIDKTLADARERFAVEEDERKARLKVLKGEVEALEVRRRKALIPIDQERLEAENRRKEAEELMARAVKAYDESQILRERYEDEIDAVAVTKEEAEADREEARRILRGAREQEKTTAERARILSEEGDKFLVLRLAVEQQLRDRERAVSLREIAVQEKDRWHEEEKGRLAEEQRVIDDRRATLDRAFKRLKEKQHG